MGNVMVASISLSLNTWPISGQFGVKGSLNGQKLIFSLQMTIKSWYYVQLFETGNLMVVSIFCISKYLTYLLGFSEVKRGKTYKKLSIRLEVIVKCWNCLKVSYFRQETLWWYLVSTSVFKTYSNI